VDISSDVTARVSQLAIVEGQQVTEGQVLLRLDPAQFEAAVARAEAALSQSQAQVANQQASLLRSQRDHERLLALRARDTLLVIAQQVEDAKTGVEMASANVSASEFGVKQAMASLDEARDRLSKTVFRAPISGMVTRLTIREGETVVIGTMNNPGSLLLTISDLSVVEVVVQVDETEVPGLTVGDSAKVDIDAFPNMPFTGRVTEIGHSAIRPPSSAAASGTQAAVDFEVVITLDPSSVALRPDLSATAEIVTDMRSDVVAVPILSLTVRVPPTADDPAPARSDAEGEVEGVFVVREGRAVFAPVVLGIAGLEYFEAISGLQPGDTVVAGPYQAIRDLLEGNRVKGEEVPPPPARVPAGA
jgi:HlyD family secretion protein